jgi:hypothetical protein
MALKAGVQGRCLTVSVRPRNGGTPNNGGVPKYQAARPSLRVGLLRSRSVIMSHRQAQITRSRSATALSRERSSEIPAGKKSLKQPRGGVAPPRGSDVSGKTPSRPARHYALKYNVAGCELPGVPAVLGAFTCGPGIFAHPLAEDAHPRAGRAPRSGRPSLPAA